MGKSDKFKKLILLVIFITIIVLFDSCKKEKEETITYTKKEDINFIINFGTPIDIILILDQSSSMSGYANFPATDPNNLRIEASKYFLNNLSRRSETEPYLRIGIVNFGTRVPKEYIVDLTTVTSKLNDEGLNRLINSLKPLNLEYTSFIRAFNTAYEIFEKNKTVENNRKPIIVLFTDGEPDDERNYSLRKYFDEIKNFYKNKLEKIGCEIYLIGIDNVGNVWSKTIPYWKEFLDDNHIFKITNIEELNQKYNEIIQKIFYLPTTQPDIVIKSLEFDVQPYLDKIQFDIYPETKNIEIEIIDAEGKKISEKDPNVFVKDYPTYKTLIISNPIPGKWKYEIVKGVGKVKIYKTLIPNKLSLISPNIRETFGKKFYVIFGFFKEDQKEVNLLPEYPLIFSGKIISPLGEVINLEFIKEDKGIYKSIKEYEPNVDGKYKIILTATGRGGFEINNEYIINVIKAPYITINYPNNNSIIKGYKEKLDVDVTLNYDKSIVDPAKFFSNNPNALIWAQIVHMPDGTKSKIVVPLKQTEDQKGRFKGSIPQPLNRKGNYILKVELDGIDIKTQNNFKDTATIMFNVQPSILDYIKTYWLILIGVLIALMFIYYIYFISVRAKLEGSIIINNEEYPLSGYKVTLGGNGSNINIYENVKGPVAIIYGVYSKMPDENEKVKIIKIKYKSSEESKTFDQEDELVENLTVTVLGKNIKYKKY